MKWRSFFIAVGSSDKCGLGVEVEGTGWRAIGSSVPNNDFSHQPPSSDHRTHTHTEPHIKAAAKS
ncbi:hypothetical protein YC2023_061533 [Brassica napus]